MTLLWIAYEPETTQVDLVTKAGIGRSSVNRAVILFGPKRMGGLDLISAEESPLDRRRKVLRLTPQGDRVIRSIQHLMSK